ncbi:MAG: glycosyl transferase [Flavobacteriales bacterium]|nr:glycosyl transferase [Flavobacteriales bacterium]
MSAEKHLQLTLYSPKELNQYAKKKKIDLIHAHDSHAHSFALIAASLFGNVTPIVVSRRVDFKINRSSIKKYNHKKIKKIICVSNAIKEVLYPDIGDKSILTTVHSGIDLNKFSFNQNNNQKLRKEYQIPSNVKIIGNVAAIAPHKDYYTFINTAEEIVKRNLNVKFFIIGTGPLEEKIKQYCIQKKLSNHIIFTGFRTDIQEILPELDIFLMTSETEGLGTSIIDAFACQLPVVATRAGGIPEIVQHEKNGLLADIKDANELANQIERILNGSIDLDKIINEQQKTLQKFTKSVTAHKTLLEYLAITKEKS